MSEREKCAAILDSFTDAQLVNVVTMLQSMKQAIDDAQNPEIPTAETVASRKEILEMVHTGSGKPFTGSTADMFAAILAEND